MHLDEYRKLAEVEDRMWYFKALNRRCCHWLDKHVPPGGATVLDVGCGTGGLSRALKATNSAWAITALDFMPLACTLTRERAKVPVVEGSILALPFPAASFEVVVAADVLSQVDDASTAVLELARVVRPGGIVLIYAPACMWLWSYHDKTCETKHRFTRPELVALCLNAGLTIRYSSYANSLTLPLFILWRKCFSNANATSDVKEHSPVIDRFAATLAWFEYTWQRAGLSSPIGSSVFIVCSRPAT